MLRSQIFPNAKIELKEAKITIIGLDGSGKTTFLNQLLDEDMRVPTITPTLEINRKTLYTDKKQKITFIDVPGQKSLRQITWTPSLKDIQGLIIMIDSGDPDKFKEGAQEIEWVIKEESIKGVPILVYANKQDLETAVEPEEIEIQMQLDRISTDREYCIQPSVAVQGVGVAEGTKWLLEHLKKSKV